ncbi:MAG: glycosyltransferase family 4 protein [Pedobacter sp.]
MIKVLHLTAHLGGGVGKALSGLVVQAVLSGADIEHTIVTLEKQEKTQFIELIQNSGCKVIVCPTREQLNNLIESSDVVQLEWWNHPATIKALCSQPLPPMRLLVWSHVSGLYNPIIPSGLILAAQRFLFTSACSFEAREVKNLPGDVRDKIGVVSSSGGFDALPSPETKGNDMLVVGYIGSLNFAKMHPRYVEFMSKVNIPGFKVNLIGDVTNKDILEQQCIKLGTPKMLAFRGYTNDIASELASINVLAYLLNPEHYGTTENALIEAMSMGIVPIVLDNPAERLIVEDHKTGLIVSTPAEFAEAVNWLSENPKGRQKIGMQAAEFVRGRFTARNMENALNTHYKEGITFKKQRISFVDIFGRNPADWFLSCQSNAAFFYDDGNSNIELSNYSRYGLFEQSKGTVFHFHKYFPDNQRLQQWSKTLMSLK